MLSGVLLHFVPVYFLKMGSFIELGARLVAIDPRNPRFFALYHAGVKSVCGNAPLSARVLGFGNQFLVLVLQVAFGGI